MEKNKIIEFKNVDIFYNKKQNVLNDVNLNIYQGEFISIFGKNGSGKTSLIKTLHGIVKYSGNILLKGKNIKNISKRKIARQISYIAQTQNEFDGVRVLDFLLMSRFPHNSFLKINKSDDVAHITKLLKRFKVEGLANKFMEDLSGGQKQIISIICGIAQGSDILLVDEPTNHLDPKIVLQVFEIFKKLKEEGKTIILISHSINDTLKLSDKLILINNQKIFAYGPTHKILNKKNIDHIFEIKSTITKGLITDLKL